MFELAELYRELAIKRNIIALSEGSAAALSAFSSMIDQDDDIDVIDDIVSFIAKTGIRGNNIYYFWTNSCNKSLEKLFQTMNFIEEALEAKIITNEEIISKIKRKEAFVVE